MNVMLLNDDQLELEQMKLLIESVCPHWHLFVARAEPTAIDLAANTFIDLVFLNINHPDQYDLKIAKKLRQFDQVRDIVIVTAHQDFSIAHAAIKIGAADFLTKPISADELNTVLSKFSQKEAPTPVYSPLIKKVLTILERHYADRLSLADIAAALYVNPSYLSRRFKAEIGHSYSKFLIKFRLKIVKDLLVDCPDLSIAQIAEQTGFASQQYLSTLFHRNTGLTPREYRDSQRISGNLPMDCSRRYRPVNFPDSMRKYFCDLRRQQHGIPARSAR